MGRYLCQLCWSIVHYGERHPCFFYKEDEEFYTVPPPKPPVETEGRHEETEGTHSGNWNDNNLHICAAAQADHDEESKERNSFVIENHEGISLEPASRRKRRRCPMFPLFRGITSTNMDSKCTSNANIERDDHKDGEKKSKVQRKRKSASAEATRIEESSSIGMATCSSALGSVARGEAENVAVPSRIRTQPLGSENERAFVCDVCGRDFTRKGNLDRHLKTHTGEKPFACPTCDKAFSQKSNLEGHIRNHTGEKRFECDICGERFVRKDYLVVHRRNHTGEKPFNCKSCGKEFANPGHYRRHMKNIHGEE